METENVKRVLLDADVIFHFITNSKLIDLEAILFPHQCVILEQVYAEVSLKQNCKTLIDQEISKKRFIKIAICDDAEEIKKESSKWERRVRLYGDGQILKRHNSQ